MTGRRTTPEQDAKIVAAHVAEFARLCALPGADCTLLEKAAAEFPARVRAPVEEPSGG